MKKAFSEFYRFYKNGINSKIVNTAIVMYVGMVVGLILSK